MTRLSLCAVVSVALCGCAYKAAPATVSSPDAYSRTEHGRVMIRSGSLGLRVKDLDATKTSIEEILASIQGRIDEWSSRDGKWLNMKLRVPEARLDETMDRIATLGKVTERSVSSRDVTDELIDLEARLRNLQALRDRLRSYLDKAANLEEILGVERELARVQSEIESLEAKVKVLKDRIAMSQLEVRARKETWF